ncbi:hypothetical protein ACFQJC_08045 [Haloferax namakaokahaiae]|uniref:Uncharacterized protein n=1 Tax=Haloferax namakaokahaiae TaxID=1748331 RepID=A0ABD5ZDS9_9EURY
MSAPHKKTADFSSMAQTMRACGGWTPVSPLDDENYSEDDW